MRRCWHRNRVLEGAVGRRGEHEVAQGGRILAREACANLSTRRRTTLRACSNNQGTLQRTGTSWTPRQAEAS